MKKFLSLTLAFLMSMALAAPAFAETAPSTPIDAIEENYGIMPLDLTLEDGDINNRNGLNTSITLNRTNGKYVNLYVENKGTNSVVATINGQSERTFAPGESGHIYVEVTQKLFGGDREYVFKVEAGPNGGRINIHYEIAQRNSQDPSTWA